MKLNSFFQSIPNKLSLREYLPKADDITSWAAVNLILCSIKGEIHVAMIKRAINHQDPWSGHYAFPGGRRENTETFLEAANRETFEEIGIDLNASKLHKEFLRFQVQHQEKFYPFGISAFIHKIEEIPGTFVLEEREVAAAFWLPLKHFLNPDHVSWKPLAKNNNIDYPCIEFEGHTIWGLSYFILWELFSQLEGHCDHSHLPPFYYHKRELKNEE